MRDVSSDRSLLFRCGFWSLAPLLASCPWDVLVHRAFLPIVDGRRTGPWFLSVGSAVVRCGIPHFCFRFYVSEGPHRCVLVDASALGPGMSCCACLLGMISGELDFRVSRNFLPGVISLFRTCPADRLRSGVSTYFRSFGPSGIFTFGRLLFVLSSLCSITMVGVMSLYL